MNRERLKGYLQSGMSLSSIAKATGKHPSTVSYWLGRYGLKPNGAEKHRSRGGLKEADLRPLAEAGLPVREIAERLERSQRTVRYWIDKYGLPAPIEVRNRVRNAKLAAGERTLEKRCHRHGPATFVIENSGRTRCRQCRQDAVGRWRRRAKNRLVEEAGGACQQCGYSTYSGALEFHHLDPAQKSFGLSARGVSRAFNELRREAAKCVLLCANCHAEVEGGVRSLALK